MDSWNYSKDCCKTKKVKDEKCLQILNQCSTKKESTNKFKVSFGNDKSECTESDLDDDSQ